MIVILILIALVVAANAILDAKLIMCNQKINHTLEYGIFFVICLILTVGITELWQLGWNFGKMLLTAFWASTLARIALFNIINYYERGLRLDYESTQTTSVIDKTEHKLWQLIWDKLHIRLHDVFLSIIALLAYIIIIISFL